MSEYSLNASPFLATSYSLDLSDNTRSLNLDLYSDVISTRRLSYILYLPDPTKDWEPEWGGGLELYAVKEKNTPAETPKKVIPPSEF